MASSAGKSEVIRELFSENMAVRVSRLIIKDWRSTSRIWKYKAPITKQAIITVKNVGDSFSINTSIRFKTAGDSGKRRLLMICGIGLIQKRMDEITRATPMAIQGV
jgi:hypothetical protein